ncbi:hypothetical protein LPJ60_005659, partial [Coemansia sp. RSA 2675]
MSAHMRVLGQLLAQWESQSGRPLTIVAAADTSKGRKVGKFPNASQAALHLEWQCPQGRMHNDRHRDAIDETPAKRVAGYNERRSDQQGNVIKVAQEYIHGAIVITVASDWVVNRADKDSCFR